MAVTDISPSSGEEPGRNERAVLAEVESYRSAAARPGIVQAALTLGRLLDDDTCKPQWSSATSRLAELLEVLRRGGEVRKSTLASVQKLAAKAG